MSQQQAEFGQVRLLTTLEVLERVLKAGANPDDVETLAIELGVARWMRKDKSNARNIAVAETPV